MFKKLINWFFDVEVTEMIINDNEYKKLTQEAKSNYAKQLIKNPVFNGIINAMKDETVKSWQSTTNNDSVSRETLWLSMKMIEKLYATIKFESEKHTLDLKTKEKRKEIEEI